MNVEFKSPNLKKTNLTHKLCLPEEVLTQDS